MEYASIAILDQRRWSSFIHCCAGGAPMWWLDFSFGSIALGLPTHEALSLLIGFLVSGQRVTAR